jgi:uncharacterized RDD family membrane protein YckC/ribosomal protein L40E
VNYPGNQVPQIHQPSPSDIVENSPAKAVKICTGCRTRNQPASQYCYKCGLKLPEQATIRGTPVKVCLVCHTSNSPTSEHCFKCGLKLPEETTVPGEYLVPAGFWIRFASFLIDNIFVIIGSLVFTLVLVAIIITIFPNLAGNTADEFTWDAVLTASEKPATWLDWAIYVFLFVFGLAYFTFTIGRKGQTLGKLMLGLKVVRTDGSRAGYLRAFVRSWGYLLCIASIGIGFLVIAWNDQKRGLHDFISNTKVIKT